MRALARIAPGAAFAIDVDVDAVSTIAYDAWMESFPGVAYPIARALAP